ncbi:MAG: molybdate ABC transporter substrate-binding protein [Candidatus Rokubacteria bacterium]|nr:molybdate ABC transporter substrate-binding protein [Candidatus Rokubacteria bacterium]
MRRLLAAVLLLAAAAPAGAPPPPALTVFAASDLAFAFQELGPRFERAVGAKVTLVLGSSGNFARQIEHGAPADVFFSADEQFVDRLVERGLVIRETRALYGQGRLALATAKAAGLTLADLRQLRDPRVRRVAIANPAHAPYGRAAEAALRTAGVWDAVKPKLVFAENVRHALQYVQLGAVEAGIVALSIARVPEIEWAPIDSTLHAPLNQAAGVVRRSARPELGLAFIQFVNGPDGRPVMKRYGFLLPGEF